MEFASLTCTRMPPIEVRGVWESNLVQEFSIIHKAIERKYNCATLDTEFKLAPEEMNLIKTHPRFASPEERYHVIKARTDKGGIRQLGLTLSADDGSVLVWEFNFGPFHVMAMWCNNNLINKYSFSKLLLSSGLLDKKRMMWIMFHGAYDLAYLIKLAISWNPLPDTLVEFESLVKDYLGKNVFDVKYMVKFTNNLFGGLEEVAKALHVERVAGLAHQAGSDSLLTWHTFQKMKEVYFPHNSDVRHASVFYGIHDI